MTLATRCPNCQTVFKVVQDQLRVSEGWVRCGRCAEVFNAAQHLVDADGGQARRAPIEVHRAFTPPAVLDSAEMMVADEAPAAARQTAGNAPSGYGDDIEAELRERLAARPRAASRPAPLDADGAAHSASSTTPPAAAGSASPAPEAGSVAASAASEASLESATSPADEPLSALADQGAPTLAAGERALAASAAPPSFVREAERAERWHRPAVRALLAAGLVAGSALLAAQWLVVWRDQAAARWPALRPLLAQACDALDCRIEAVRAIESLAVESSGLVRVEKSDLYRLALALRNQGGYDVALPAIDLALTDTQGQLIARRVLRAAELGARSATLAAHGDLALQATIEVTAAPVTGYTIELFYP